MRRLADAAQFNIVVFVAALGHLVERRIGDFGKHYVERRDRHTLLTLKTRKRRLQFRDFGFQFIGPRNIVRLDRDADVLRGDIAPLLRGLRFGDRRPALVVKCEQLSASGSRPRLVRPLSKASALSQIHLMSYIQILSASNS